MLGLNATWSFRQYCAQMYYWVIYCKGNFLVHLRLRLIWSWNVWFCRTGNNAKICLLGYHWKLSDVICHPSQNAVQMTNALNSAWYLARCSQRLFEMWCCLDRFCWPHSGCTQYSAIFRVGSDGAIVSQYDLTQLRDGDSRCLTAEDTDVCDQNYVKCQKTVEVW